MVRRCVDCEGLLYWVRPAVRGALPKRCLACKRDAERERHRRWREANREARVEHDRRRHAMAWRERPANRCKHCDALLYWVLSYCGTPPRTCSECKQRYYEAKRDAERERKQRWREANPDAERERQRRWREANREALRERARRWRAEKPHVYRDNVARYRARKRSAYVASVYRVEIYERDHGRCQLAITCTGRKKLHPDEWHLDHIIPLAEGGTHEPANVHVACAACNLAKGTRPVGEQTRLIG
jgi:hypothetical protein